MTRFSSFIFLLAFLFIGTPTALFAASRPNIILIIADDQAPHTLKTYGNTVCQTPTLDRLSSQGITLDGAHHMGAWAGGVCTPSRHMIMTGRTVWHIPDKSKNSSRNPNAKNPKLVPPDLRKFTMPAVFNNAGYVTFRTCKSGNSYEAANKLFQIRKDGTKRGNTRSTGSAWHADQAIAFLQSRGEQSASKRKPFLIYFGFSHPHDTRDGKPELLAK